VPSLINNNGEAAMSVVTGRYDDLYGAINRFKCSECGELLRRYPFLHWHPEICFCADCCLRIKPGFIADLIQITAITEFQRIVPRYDQFTFIRRSLPALERAHEKEQEAIRQIERQAGITRLKRS
jgi:hypothetical protein